MSECAVDSRIVALRSGSIGGLGDVGALGSHRFSPFTLVRLRQAMAAADITIAHGSTTVLACAMSGGGKRRPFVVRQISESSYWLNTAARRWRVARYLHRARGVIALAQSAAAELHDLTGVPLRKIRVIPNGVRSAGFQAPTSSERKALRARLGLHEHAVVVCYVGALVAEKGVDRAIRAVAAIKDVHLVVAGDGPARSDLEQLARQSDPTRIHFTGQTDEPEAIYKLSDATLLTSRGGDSMPASIIEAAFCGVPAIASDVGAIRDLIVDGVTGFVVSRDEANDHELVARLSELANDHLRTTEMGTAARAHCIGQYEMSKVTGAWLSELADLARRG